MNNDKIIAYYDGHCGLCHMAVVFLLKRDQSGIIYFAPIQSELYKTFANVKKIALTPRSILVYNETEGRMLSESAAVFYLLRNCGGFWRGVVGVWDMVPIRFWNRLYRLVASVRHRLFAKPKGLVPELPELLKSGF
ncbi:MAG: DUF393 domain-containing protein [bacterium]|nr:DUF393 domain-containing protein [bacterium]